MPRVKGQPKRIIIQNSPENSSSSEDEETVGLGQGERENNEDTPQETAEESGSQQSSELVKTSAEENPIPGPSSEGSKGRNLKRSNDRAKETHGAKQKKKSTSTVSDSDESNKPDRSGICGECPERDYHSDIYNHFNVNHIGLQRKKCTATGCRIHFGSDRKRRDHETIDQHFWKKLRCEHCSHSTEKEYNLKTHVLRIHLKKTVKCEELKCSSMFASEAVMKQHVNDKHKREKCPTCGKEMTASGLRQHNLYGRCRGAAE